MKFEIVNTRELNYRFIIIGIHWYPDNTIFTIFHKAIMCVSMKNFIVMYTGETLCIINKKERKVMENSNIS